MRLCGPDSAPRHRVRPRVGGARARLLTMKGCVSTAQPRARAVHCWDWYSIHHASNVHDASVMQQLEYDLAPLVSPGSSASGAARGELQ